MQQDLKRMGYNVSFGIAVYQMGTQAAPDIYDIVREAENDMSADKEAFYRQQENNRSSR
ncbi:MAG: hypothetical protein Q4B54_14055 [Coriobacteriales bacterium]|nr:hypothetical protein [Coriobacteriales bacterium]